MARRDDPGGDCTSASWSNTIAAGAEPCSHATGDAARIRLVPLPAPGGPQHETKAMAPGFDHGRSRRLAERAGGTSEGECRPVSKASTAASRSARTQRGVRAKWCA